MYSFGFGALGLGFALGLPRSCSLNDVGIPWGLFRGLGLGFRALGLGSHTLGGPIATYEP